MKHDCTNNPRPNTRKNDDLPLYAYAGGKPRSAPTRYYPAMIIYPLLGAGLGWFWYWVLTSIRDLLAG